MKNAYIIFILAVFFTGCSEDFLVLENPNQIDSENYFTSESDILTAVNGVYSITQKYPSVFYLYLSEGRSNNYYSGTSNAQRDLVDISSFNVTSELSTLEDAWEYGYATISKANKVLSVIDGIEFSTEDLKNQSEAEVKFLRAYTHFELMRVFGKIPVVDELISPEEALTIGRSELTDVFSFIEEDLSYAISNLPTSYSSDDAGRITKQAAMALLAKVYLTWGQYPVADQSKVLSAIDYLELLINTSGYMNWANNYEDIFLSTNDNKYCLFEIQYISGTSGLGATFPSEFLTSSMKDFAFSGGVPRFSPSDNLVNAFDVENDKRFDATFDTTYINNYWITVKEDIITKWFESGISLLSRSDWPQNYPILRPAEIYLMYAEALNLTNNTPTTAAIEALNKTRNRAGIEDVNPATSDEFTIELMNEYRREFVGEGVYWHYLVRSGSAVNVMNEWLEATSQDKTINENKLIYPIPYSQMVIKEGLYTQNTGY